MLYDELASEICFMVREEKKCSETLKKILQHHKCLYVLSHLAGQKRNADFYIMMNESVQNFRYTFCRQIFKELSCIPYAIIKGAALSEKIYGKPYYRSSGDIDLLVSPNHIDHVTKILKQNGFIQGRVNNDRIEKYTREELLYHKLYTHQLASFEKKTDFLLCPFVNIDVNFDVLWGEADLKIDMEEYLLHTEKRIVFGVEVFGLSPVYEFIALCLHHYKDMNSIYLLAERGLCLNEFFDIYYYLINVKPDLDELSEITEYYHVKEYVYYCIFYTNEILRSPWLEEYLVKLETPKGISILECYGLNDAERNKWDIPFCERLFDKDFKDRFLKRLGETELQKIETNRQFM